MSASAFEFEKEKQGYLAHKKKKAGGVGGAPEKIVV